MKCSRLGLGFVLLIFIVILIGYFDVTLNVPKNEYELIEEMS